MDQLIDKVRAYLDGGLTLVQFQSFLTKVLQSMKPSGNDAIIQLASEMDADIVWLSEGLIDLKTFRNRLQGYVSSVKYPAKI